MVVFDSSFLILLLYPAARAPIDPNTKVAVTHPRERVEGLIKQLGKAGETILIPAPVLGEILAHAGDAMEQYLEILKSSRHVRIVPFDERAAIESAILFGPGMQRRKKRGGATGDWQKVKVDQQTVAIARVYSARTIYSNDRDVVALCKGTGVSVERIEDVPIPRDAMQVDMGLPEH